MVDRVVVDPGVAPAIDPKADPKVDPKVDPKADPAKPVASDAKVKPEGVPDKFWNAETGEVDYTGLTKSYNELEKKLSSGKKPDGTVDPTNPDAAAAAQAVAKAGLNFETLTAEYAKGGELSTESYKALEDAGIPRAVVDSYIAGQEALSERTLNDIKLSVGGDEAYAGMLNWASQNLTEAERNAYNRQMGGDLESVKLAVQTLYTRFTNTTGKQPNLIKGDTIDVGGARFESVAQVTAAMQDPRYKKDPAYRAEVAAKLANSKVF